MDAMYIGHSAARDDSCSESNRAIAVFVCMGFLFSTCARSLAAPRSMAFMAGRFGERACLLFILQANRDDPTIIYSYMCCYLLVWGTSLLFSGDACRMAQSCDDMI